MIDFKVQGSEDLRRMARALRLADTGGGMARDLQKAMKLSADPMKRSVQKAAEGIHTTGHRKPGAKHPFDKVLPPKGTRKKIAGAVTVDAKVSEDDPRLSIRVASAKLPPTLKNMPQRFDRGVPWRHPIPGGRAWVSQESDPWFFENGVRPELRNVRERLDRAIGETRDRLERA